MTARLLVRAISCLGIGVMVAATGISNARVPQRINYQAQLTDISTGEPLGGPHAMVFRIFSQESGGTALWTETWAVDADPAGVVSVILGSDTPIDVAFSGPLWLEVEVDREVLSPRREMVSVPYAFTASNADSLGGIPASSYIRDGYSLDASDGDPADAVYVDSQGQVGIGTTNPDQALQVDGNIRARSLLLGSESQDGWAEIFRMGSANSVVAMGSFEDLGGGINLRDYHGQVHTAIEPDGNGDGGGYLRVRSSSIEPGVTIDGNYAGTQKPRVTIYGSSGSALFCMDQSGDASVQLPSDAISETEILNEPGVANHVLSGFVDLTRGVETLVSRTISAPGAGYVLAIASAEASVSHSSEGPGSVDLGVSDDYTAFPDNEDLGIYIPTSAAGSYHYPVTVHGLFEVDEAGDYTYFFLARQNSGDCIVLDVQLTLVYFPTAYGMVDPVLAAGGGVPDDKAPGGAPATLEDIAEERTQARALSAARVQRELAQMHARIEVLQKELSRGNR